MWLPPLCRAQGSVFPPGPPPSHIQPLHSVTWPSWHPDIGSEGGHRKGHALMMEVAPAGEATTVWLPWSLTYCESPGQPHILACGFLQKRGQRSFFIQEEPELPLARLWPLVLTLSFLPLVPEWICVGVSPWTRGQHPWCHLPRLLSTGLFHF